MSKLRFFYLAEAKGGEGGGEGGGGAAAGAGGEVDLGSIEERARRMGWRPKDEFQGESSKFVDAATYVKNGEESLPILRERLRTMERSLAESARAAKEFREFSEKSEERAYKRAKAELEGKIRSTAKAGDEDGAAAASEALAQLERDRVAREEKGKQQPDPEFDAWLAQNRWYNEKDAGYDSDLALEAEAEAYKLRKRGSKLEGVAFLEAVADAVKKRFPDKFGNPRRRNGSGVEGAGGEAGSGGGAGASKKGWDALPADAKESGLRFIKQGFVKDKAAYAEQYWKQEE